MGLFTMAWLIGEGIIAYRSVSKNHAPPMPGALIASSGLFALLALLAESDSARPIATALAFGFDIAAFMNLYPPVTGGGTAGATAGATSSTPPNQPAGAGPGGRNPPTGTG